MLSWAQAANAKVFARSDWEQHLHEEWRSHFREREEQGNWESAEAYELRVKEDLQESKETLERELGVKVNVLCWPENVFSPVGEGIAHRLGYTATVSNRHDSQNVVGEAPDRIVRVFVGKDAVGFHSSWLDFVVFVLELKVFEGWYVAYALLFLFHRAKRMVWAARQMLFRREDYISIWSGRRRYGGARRLGRPCGSPYGRA
jgi:hypothetical protein